MRQSPRLGAPPVSANHRMSHDIAGPPRHAPPCSSCSRPTPASRRMRRRCQTETDVTVWIGTVRQLMIPAHVIRSPAMPENGRANGTGSCERGGLAGTETHVREGFAGAEGQPSTIGRLRGADDGAEARSVVSHTCEPVPNVLPNVRLHEREHSDSHKTVPVACANPSVRTGLSHPLARTFPNAGIRTRPRLSPRTHKGPASHMAHGSPGAHAIVAPASRLRPRSRGATRPRCPARPDAPRSSCDRRQGRGRAPGRRR